MLFSCLPSPSVEAPTQQQVKARQWHVLYVWVKSEKKVARQLEERNLPHYLPTRKEVRRWSDRRMTIIAPLFPGYLFVQCSAFERALIMRLPGVVRFVTRGPAAAIIPDDEFGRLKTLLQMQSVDAHDYLEPGRRVILNGGAFDGFEGTYIREKGKLRAIVAIDWLQRSVIVDVDACDLQPSARYAYIANA